VVGSIKFVGGMRKEVLAKLAEKIAACGVDEVSAAKGGISKRSSNQYITFLSRDIRGK
jgi:hypothetical protein